MYYFYLVSPLFENMSYLPTETPSCMIHVCFNFVPTIGSMMLLMELILLESENKFSPLTLEVPVLLFPPRTLGIVPIQSPYYITLSLRIYRLLGFTS